VKRTPLLLWVARIQAGGTVAAGADLG